MADQREGGIDWCDVTWNPVRGCTRVSPGCENCYAERVAARFSGPGQAYEGLAHMKLVRVGSTGLLAEKRPRWTGEVRLVPEHLADPLRWRRPRRVFVNSMSDLFHEKLANDDIDRVFAVMALAPQHTFQILTKRPERMRQYMTEDGIGRVGYVEGRAKSRLREMGKPVPQGKTLMWPLPNVWLGVTAEDQQRADERIPLLLETPAAKRFVSVEPQLGPVDLSRYLALGADGDGPCTCGKGGDHQCPDAPLVDWVIQGCESGHGARPFDIGWALSMRDQCVAAGVAYFLKQAPIPGEVVGYPKAEKNPLLQGRTWKEFPRG